jgi:hypothetical protein
MRGALFLLGLVLCAPGRAQGALYFLPSHEHAVEALVRPHTLDALTLAGRRLEGVSLGPDCRMTFRFAATTGGGAASVELAWEGALTSDQGGGLITRSAGDGGEVLERALLAQVEARLTPAFFRAHCRSSDPAPPEDRPPPTPASARAAAHAEASRARWAPSPLAAASALAFALGVIGLAVARRRQRGDDPGLPLAPPSRRDRAWTAALLALTLAPRLAISLAMGPDQIELTTLLMSETAWHDLVFGREPGWFGFWYGVHPPGHPILIETWARLGSLFGTGGALWWLRLPNLVAATILVLALDRIGRALEIQHITRPATVLMALLPEPLVVGIMQANYVWEAALSLLALERGLAILARRRAACLSFAGAALAATWMGFVAALVTAPITAAVLLALLRRRARLAAGALLLIAAAGHAPLARSALQGTAFLSEQDEGAFADGAPAGEHEGFTRLFHAPHSVTTALHARPTYGIVAIGLGLLTAARSAWAAASFAALVAAFMAMGLLMPVRWVNMALLQPWLALLPLWGGAALAGVARRRLGAGRRTPSDAVVVWAITLASLAGVLHARAPLLAEWLQPVTVHGEEQPWSPGLTCLDGRPGPASAASWLFVPLVPRRAVRAMDDLPPGDQPLVIHDPVPRQLAYHLCDDLRSLEGLGRCHRRGDERLERDGPPQARLGGRLLIHLNDPPLSSDGAPGCPRGPFGRLVEVPELSEAPWLMWVSGGFRRALAADPACTATLADAGVACRLRVEARNLSVLECRFE